MKQARSGLDLEIHLIIERAAVRTRAYERVNIEVAWPKKRSRAECTNYTNYTSVPARVNVSVVK